ncbi:hypothetical protein JD276_04510 [Leucobacter sp. CSA1]|uniref:Uncharacterized protein n=1 Tax=Leucobacter chromiisoli TaxID=2796471 RepID=A0A934UUU9_9MICO|nr:hypothetical protein [Leucobacter chromiisoli]MBK0418292.1 hypothetical protein [Leucobacter chromiisoli]
MERLTEDHVEVVDGHATEWPPLLQWLENSVTEIVARNGGGGGGNGIPINEDALLLLDHVRKRIKMMGAALFLPLTGDVIADTQAAWAKAQDERTGNRMDDPAWEAICDEFPDWVQRITAADDRPHRMEMTTPCPRCDARWVYEIDRNEFDTAMLSPTDPRKAALVCEWNIGRAPVAECRNPDCGTLWAGWAEVARLGFTIGARQDAAVLDACGISLELHAQAG